MEERMGRKGVMLEVVKVWKYREAEMVQVVEVLEC